MMRRLVVAAALILVLGPALEAKRRTITPRGIDDCAVRTILPATFANVLAADDQFVYLIDDDAILTRVSRLGGVRQDLTEPLEEWLPLAMEVDETTVYISALPLESIVAPRSGVILAVSKFGGVPTVLASDVATAFGLAVDSERVYWAAAGLLKVEEGVISSGGKVESISKDGSDRQVLAGNLSAPFGLALDSANVYFGESGLAEGDPSVGLYRVHKSGGVITPISAEIAVTAIALAGESVVMVGALNGALGVVAIGKAGGTPRTVLEDETLTFVLRVAGREAYVMAEREEDYELLAVNIDLTDVSRVVRGDISGDAFVIDGCVVVVNSMDGNLIRAPR